MIKNEFVWILFCEGGAYLLFFFVDKKLGTEVMIGKYELPRGCFGKPEVWLYLLLCFMSKKLIQLSRCFDISLGQALPVHTN